MHDEEQRVHDRKGGPRHHPGREIRNKPSKLLTDLAGERVPEQRRDDATADKRNDSCSCADECEAHPRGVDNVIGRSIRIDASPGERRRRDQGQ